MLKNVFGAKIKIITGYPGGGEMSIAMERREIDGRCGWSWSGVKSSKPEWLSGKQINILVQLGLQKSPELPDVPLIIDQATNDEQRADPASSSSAARNSPGRSRRRRISRPIARRRCATPSRRRSQDPEFLADAKKIQIDVNPVSAAAVDRLIGELYASPESILAKLRSVTSAQ